MQIYKTYKTTPGDVKNTSTGTDQQKSYYSLMTSQRVLGGSWQWTTSAMKANNSYQYSITLAGSIIFRAKMAWCSLKDYLIDLFVVGDYPDEVVSDNGPPFNSQEFASFISSQVIVLTHYYLPQ